MSRKFLIGVMIVVAVIVGGAWEGYVWHRNRVADDIQAVLSSLSPGKNATYQTLEYSLFSDTLNVRGVVLGGRDQSVPAINIDSITIYKPNCYNMRTLFAAEKKDIRTLLPLAGAIVVEGIRGYRIGPYEVSLGRLEIAHLRACQASHNSADNFVSFFDAFEFDTITLEALDIQTTGTALPEDHVMWSTPSQATEYTHTARVEKIVFTDMEDALLKSLILTGMQLSSEMNEQKPLKEKPEYLRNRSIFSLERAALEDVKLESFQNLEKVWKNRAEGLFPALQDLVVGMLSLEGISIKSEGEHLSGSKKNAYRENSDLTVGAFILTGLGNGILKSLQIEGVDYISKRDQDKMTTSPQMIYHQEQLLLEGIDLLQLVRPFWKLQTIHHTTGRELMTAVALEQVVSPFQADRTQISNARLETPDLGVVSLGKLAGAATYREDTLVTSETTFMGLEWIPPSKDDFMQEMGYRSLAVSGRINDHFILENKEHKLSLDMEIKDGGKLALNLELGNYPRQKRSNTGTEEIVMDGLEELFLMEMRLGRIELYSASMYYDDDSLFERFSSYRARKEGISPDAVNREFLQMLHRTFEGWKPSAALSKAEKALSSFLAEPGAVTFSMKPATPLPLGDLEKLTLENLLPLLNVSMSYENRQRPKDK